MIASQSLAKGRCNEARRAPFRVVNWGHAVQPLLVGGGQDRAEERVVLLLLPGLCVRLLKRGGGSAQAIDWEGLLP